MAYRDLGPDRPRRGHGRHGRAVRLGEQLVGPPGRAYICFDIFEFRDDAMTDDHQWLTSEEAAQRFGLSLAFVAALLDSPRFDGRAHKTENGHRRVHAGAGRVGR